MTDNINKFRYFIIKPKGSTFAYLMNEVPKYDKDPYYDYDDNLHETTEDYLSWSSTFCFDTEHEVDVACLDLLNINPDNEKPVEFLLIGANNKDEAIKLLSKDSVKTTIQSSLNKKLLF